MQNKLARYWLQIGIIALSIAGLHSIILVILRTPQLAMLITNQNLFKASLVVHVNLSALVWLLSVTAAWWSLGRVITTFGIICAHLSLAGTILLGISPFFEQSIPIMNNYIPMLENIVFVLGLSIFSVGILLFACYCITQDLFRPQSLTSLHTSLLVILAWICFGLSAAGLEKVMLLVPMDLDFYYELLYWSGGHVLQFVYTQSLIIVWMKLFEAYLGRKLKMEKAYLSLLWLNFALASTAIFGHLLYDLVSAEFREFYTLHMRYAGGIAPVLAFALMLYETLSSKSKNSAPSYILAAIVCSSFLFLFGGLIGVIISGVNVTIPAHYHGCIVGISVAFMGFAYMLCKPDDVDKNIRLKSQQLYLVTIGQIMHISGLALAGGYGVMRKTPGAEMATKAKIALGLMGLGGLIAIIGGLLFVVICGKYFSSKSK